jgi:aromatic ring-opening dioxygenase LigB subunit
MGKIIKYFVMPHPPIIIPEIGKGEEKKISDTSDACDRAAEEISKLKPDTIIVITPHGPMFRDALAISNLAEISGNLRNFGAPHVKFKNNINMHLTDSIVKHADEMDIPVAS